MHWTIFTQSRCGSKARWPCIWCASIDGCLRSMEAFVSCVFFSPSSLVCGRHLHCVESSTSVVVVYHLCGSATRILTHEHEFVGRCWHDVDGDVDGDDDDDDMKIQCENLDCYQTLRNMYEVRIRIKSISIIVFIKSKRKRHPLRGMARIYRPHRWLASNQTLTLSFQHFHEWWTIKTDEHTVCVWMWMWTSTLMERHQAAERRKL